MQWSIQIILLLYFNLGKGKGSEVMEIVMHIEKIMKEKYKIEIKREVIVIGAFILLIFI